MLKVLTLSTQFAGLGGVEAILRDHHQRDADAGLDSRFTIFWEPFHEGWPRTRFLDLNIHESIGSARRRFRQAHPGFSPDIALYHTLWGWPYFADIDAAARRVAYLHSDYPGLTGLLQDRLFHVDGVVAVSQPLLDRVRSIRPDLPAHRCLQVHATIHPPKRPPRQRQHPVGPDHPLVVGYCGRVVREQKRVDRWPEWVRKMREARIPFRFEILGEGPDSIGLFQSLEEVAPGLCHGHGRLTGDEYWNVIAGWDALAFVSDYEGTPLSLLEGMSMGVIPIHPHLGSGGDLTASQVHPQCVYPPGNLDSLVDACRWIASWDVATWKTLAQRCVQVVEPHLGSAYRSSLTAFLTRIRQEPALPGRPTRPPPNRRQTLTISQT
jgi:glycosyltransferase involved in cell wall biosynthesis